MFKRKKKKQMPESKDYLIFFLNDYYYAFPSDKIRAVFTYGNIMDSGDSFGKSKKTYQYPEKIPVYDLRKISSQKKETELDKLVFIVIKNLKSHGNEDIAFVVDMIDGIIPVSDLEIHPFRELGVIEQSDVMPGFTVRDGKLIVFIEPDYYFSQEHLEKLIHVGNELNDITNKNFEDNSK